MVTDTEYNFDEDSIWDVFQKDVSQKDNHTIEEPDNCCDHGNYIYDPTFASKICGKCGIILQKRLIIQNQEWRNLKTNNQFASDPVRCSVVNNLLPNSSLSTKIVTRGRETSHLSRLNRWQSMPHSERSVYDVFQELDVKGKRHNISRAVLSSAKHFYLQVYQKNAKLLQEGKKREGLRGGKRQGLIAACLLYACKQNNMPRSQSQIAKILNYKKSDVTRGCNIFLNLIKNDETIGNIVNNIINGHHFVKEYGGILKLDYSVIRCALEIYNHIKKLRILPGNTAPSIAAGSLFLVLECMYPGMHESTIANTCSISKVTVLNVYKQLLPYRLRLLGYIYIEQYCHNLQINNHLTIRKMKKLLKILSYIDTFLDCHPQKFAAVIFYYVISSVNCTTPAFKSRFLNFIKPWTEEELCEYGRKIILYKKDIQAAFFDDPLYPKCIRKRMIVKSDVAPSELQILAFQNSQPPQNSQNSQPPQNSKNSENSENSQKSENSRPPQKKKKNNQKRKNFTTKKNAD